MACVKRMNRPDTIGNEAQQHSSRYVRSEAISNPTTHIHILTDNRVLPLSACKLSAKSIQCADMSASAIHPVPRIYNHLS